MMTSTHIVTGMHCSSCVDKVSRALNTIPGVESAKVTLDPPRAILSLESPLSQDILNAALTKVGAYALIEESNVGKSDTEPSERSLRTYHPLLLVFAFILGFASIETFRSTQPGAITWMSNFMGGFFLAFSFFKFLDLRGFASSYSSYDIITKRWLGFGYIYPFIELALGLGYLVMPMSLGLSIATAVIMGVSIIGVIQSVMNKRKIKCACLGTVFNLPMGTVTIIEDALMIVMSVGMIGIGLLSK